MRLRTCIAKVVILVLGWMVDCLANNFIPVLSRTEAEVQAKTDGGGSETRSERRKSI